MNKRARELGQGQALIFALVGVGVALLILLLFPGLLNELLKEYGGPILLGILCMVLLGRYWGGILGQRIDDAESYVAAGLWGVVLAFVVLLGGTFCGTLVGLATSPSPDTLPLVQFTAPFVLVGLYGLFPGLALGTLYGCLLKKRLERV